MTEHHSPTHATYQTHAAELAEWFAEIDSRADDIDRAFALAEAGEGAQAVELGCGDGRDSADIRAHTTHYMGVDYSGELLAIARDNHPAYADSFVESDMMTYALGQNLDAIFAFASFLHLSRQQLAQILQRCTDALRPGGVVALSMKYSDEYKEVLQEDRFGERMFYLYHPDDVRQLAGPVLEEAYRRVFDHHGKQWFVLMLQKPALLGSAT
jgi:trans-aconitate methyltransferase